jgi:isopentenyldiphosphate isomerase
METKNREKILAIFAAVCVALWLLNLLVISPMTEAWHNRSNRIAHLHKAIAEGQLLIQRQETVRGQWDHMQTNALSSNPTVAERELFTAFDRWVGKSGVTEGSFRPQLHETDTNYATVECRADVTGDIQTILRFFYEMEKDPIGVKLDSCELTSKDDNGRQLALAMDLSGLILNPPNQ